MRLIDADALLGKFNRKSDIATVLFDSDTSEAFLMFCKVADAIDSLPIIDAEQVRHGRWIAHLTELCWDVCSVCGTGCKRREEDNGADVEYNYHFCPWCGARMDGGETRSWLSFRK